MNELQLNLKEKLDKIDEEIMGYALNGYLDSRLRVLIGMWEKGYEIYTYTGGKSINYSELERQTGRDDQHLKKWYLIYDKYPDKQDYIEKEAKKKALEWTQKALQEKNVHVSNNSGENEWYTPIKFIESARIVMGSIDLDPASSDLANQIVKAEKYFTKEDNGLIEKWYGNVWMNPPYSQPLITQFSEKLIGELPNIKQACVLTNNATETEWYQGMMRKSNAICFLTGRVKFIDVNGEANGAPLQGQTIMYFGKSIDEFDNEFSQFGICMRRMI